MLVGLKRRLTQPGAWSSLPALWRTAREHIQTDMGLVDAWRWARAALAAGPEKLHGIVLKPPVVHEWRTPCGKSVLRLNRQALASALQGLFSSDLPGVRHKPVCPRPDIALHWRERVEKRRARKRAERKAKQNSVN